MMSAREKIDKNILGEIKSLGGKKTQRKRKGTQPERRVVNFLHTTLLVGGKQRVWYGLWSNGGARRRNR